MMRNERKDCGPYLMDPRHLLVDRHDAAAARCRPPPRTQPAWSEAPPVRPSDPVMRSQRAQTRQNSVTLSRRQGEQMNDSHIFLLASVYQRKSLKEVRPTLLSLRWESSRPSSSVKECYGTREWEGNYCDRVDAFNFALYERLPSDGGDVNSPFTLCHPRPPATTQK